MAIFCRAGVPKIFRNPKLCGEESWSQHGLGVWQAAASPRRPLSCGCRHSHSGRFQLMRVSGAARQVELVVGSGGSGRQGGGAVQVGLRHAQRLHQARVPAARALLHHHKVLVVHQPRPPSEVERKVEQRAPVARHVRVGVREQRDNAAVRQHLARLHVPLDAPLDAVRRQRRQHHGDDGHRGLVLGQHARRLAGPSEAHDQLGVQLLHGTHRGARQRLPVVEPLADVGARLRHELQVVHVAVDVALRLVADAHDGGGAGHGVQPAEGLLPQDHAVGAVEHEVGDVGRLRARRPRHLHHRVAQPRDKHRFAAQVGGAQQQVLRKDGLLRRQLHPEVAAAEHEAVRGVQDVLVVGQPRDALDLGKHLGLRQADLREDVAAKVDVRRAAAEAEAHKLDVVRGVEVLEQRDVVLRQRVALRAAVKLHRQLLPVQRDAILHHACHALALHRLHAQPGRPRGVARGEVHADLDDAAHVRGAHLHAVDRQHALARHCALIGRHHHALARHKLKHAVLRVAHAALRPRRVHHHRAQLARAAHRRPQVVQRLLVELARAPRKVEPRDVHPCTQQLLQHLHGAAGGAERAAQPRGGAARRLVVAVQDGLHVGGQVAGGVEARHGCFPAEGRFPAAAEATGNVVRCGVYCREGRVLCR
mmetsp:Transcript_1930/g.4859  ORF Transcript_1930/g.4859 Transcript_1930/m.4859 type:complete len:648 (-) Transcript_1930:4-1947(-)